MQRDNKGGFSCRTLIFPTNVLIFLPGNNLALDIGTEWFAPHTPQYSGEDYTWDSLSSGGWKVGNLEKIILRSQNFGFQKLGNNAILRLSGRNEAIVLSEFFRWYFSCRNPKVANFETFAFFII